MQYLVLVCHFKPVVSLPFIAALRRRWVHNLHDIRSADRTVFRVKGSVPASESFTLRDELQIRVDPTPPHSCNKYISDGFAGRMHNVFENDGSPADIWMLGWRGNRGLVPHTWKWCSAGSLELSWEDRGWTVSTGPVGAWALSGGRAQAFPLPPPRSFNLSP